ncbi:MAG: ankyrin repeat domain-containing protein [Sideroxydans sp.]|nr:ankyrin repeat domain-containing protein [Sideroxydans sp.]
MKQAKSRLPEIAALLIIVLLSIAANLPEYMVEKLIDRDIVLGVLGASVVIALFHHLRFLLFITMVALIAGANMPGGLAAALGIDPAVLVAVLVLVVAISLLNYVFLLMPTGDKQSKMDTIFSRKAVLSAVIEGNHHKLARLMEINAEINFNHEGAVPLLIAAEKGNPDIVHTLVKHGADFWVRNEEGKTPMEVALAKGFARVAEILHYAAEGKQIAA